MKKLLAVLAAVGTLVACAPAHAAQQRGAMVTPNWGTDDPAFHMTPERQQAEMAAVAGIGGTVIRFHVDWADMDAAYVDQLDQAMATAQRLHLRVILNVLGNPEPGRFMYAPDLDAYATLTRWLTARYHPYAYEVWNEPNLSVFWHSTPAEFVALVNTAAAATTTPVVSGGLWADSAPGYLRRLLALGMRPDGVGLHPYGPFNRTIRSVHKVWRGPLYLTEFGCVGRRKLLTQFRAARRYPYVRALTMFSMRDYGANDNWDQHCGILNTDLSPKYPFHL